MPTKLIHGIDCTKINRSEFHHPHLAQKILSPEELMQYQGQTKYLAVRWAIKEAIFKALNLRHISYHDITIIHQHDHYQWINPPPYIKQIVISTSQEADVIIASVFGLYDPQNS